MSFSKGANYKPKITHRMSRQRTSQMVSKGEPSFLRSAWAEKGANGMVLATWETEIGNHLSPEVWAK